MISLLEGFSNMGRSRSGAIARQSAGSGKSGTREVRRMGGRPSVAESRRIQDDILKAALKLFIAHGYGATSAEEIAVQAGVSKPTLYRHFANKAEIFDAMIRAQIEETDTGANGGWTDPPISGDLESDLFQAALRGLKNSYSPMSEIVRLVHAEAARFPELGDILYRAGRLTRSLVARILCKYGWKEADAEQLGSYFISLTFDDPIRHMLLRPQKKLESSYVKKHLEATVRLFLYGAEKARPLRK